jgi:hypothetical protein
MTLNITLTLSKQSPKHDPAPNADAKSLQRAAMALRAAIASTIYVSRSRIVGAGGGLYANQRFGYKDTIAVYQGRRVPREEVRDADTNTAYMLRTTRGYLDGHDPAGRLLLDTGLKLNTHAMSNTDWLQLQGRGVRWLGLASLARFANHSTHPNARFKGTSLVAKRPIAPNEEITINYSP